MTRRIRPFAVIVRACCAAALFFTAAAASAQQATADSERVTHHEFQVNCAPSHELSDDPIVFPGQPGKSHNHTFLGNMSTDANSTLGSLSQAPTTCKTPDDHSAYWFPTMSGPKGPIIPNFPQVIYYKSGITDYTKVVPFPPGLQLVAGDMMATEEEFSTAPGAVEGYQCGSSFHNWDIPSYCQPGSQLNIRYKAPSCWNGIDLTAAAAAAAGRGKHMAYPEKGVCPAGFPIAVPMLEFKMAFPVSGDMTGVALASGAGYSWHYDFFNAWDEATLAALVKHCINGGLQCDARGYDQHKPSRGAALGPDYRLPKGGQNGG